MALFLFKSLLYCYISAVPQLVKPVNPAALHPLHVSTSDISYNAKDAQVEVILSIFTDDFERALEKQYHTKADLTKPEMHNSMDALVKSYAAGHLQIKINGAALPLNYLGFEINKEAVNVYLESGKAAAPKKIDADVSLLQTLYDDQLNIVHMTVAGLRKSAKLDSPARKVSQEF